MTRPLSRGIAAFALAGLASGAQAHTGHGTSSLFAGLVHPFGPDHLLAMVAVGLWSVYALPAGTSWRGPAAFLLALVVSAGLGASGFTVPHLELAISASVVVLGVLLVLATRPRPALPAAAGLGLVALAASLHGLAHGAEAPAALGLPAGTSFAAYALGFLATTALLHAGGVLAGLSLRRWSARRAAQVVGGMGLACAGAGLAWLSQF
jgi:urease accessory protein